MVSQHLLEDFKAFLTKYREDWNSCHEEKIVNHLSQELKTRWADPSSVISDWGYQEARDGWKQAYTAYESRDPEWHFEDILTEINSNQEGMAVFWVRFKIDGEFLKMKKLFIETFRKENGEWKKIREYVELPISTEK